MPGGFDRDDLTVDHAAKTVICPNGETVAVSAKGNASFGRRCHGCPLRARCTTNKSGRSLHISAHDARLVAARPPRPPSSPRPIRAGRWSNGRSPGCSEDGHRRCRYRGVKRNQLGLSLRVAAVNFTRLCDLGTHYDGGWEIPAVV